MKETNQNNSDYSFIEEKIKERPINKKKLIRKTLFTAGAAIIFGIVACITFLGLEPVFSKLFTPKEDTQLQQVVIPVAEEDAAQDDTLPEITIEETPIEDMTLDDTTTALDGVSENGDDLPAADETMTIIETVPLELEDYQLLHRKMYALSEEVQKSLVTVTGVVSDVDWMNSSYQSSSQTIGLILSDNGRELLVLADSKNIKDTDQIKVTFCDGAEVDAVLKQTDGSTGLAVYAVKLSTIPMVTRDVYKKASVGSSYNASVLGSAVLAIGSPTGISNSLCSGAVTSTSLLVSVPDANYQILTTDIYGSQNASGVLVNLRGQVIGFITQDYHEDDMENLIYAYGFSSIRKLIENMSNDMKTPYLGLFLTDVTEQAVSDYDIPQGAYITKVGLNSPAVNVGVSSGDVIIVMNDKPITSVNDYMAALTAVQPGEVLTMTLMRYNGEEYVEYTTEIHVESE